MVTRSLSALAQEAIDVQDAVNIRGVATGYNRMLTELNDRLKIMGQNSSSTDLAEHPIVRLWVCKMASMTFSRCAALNDQYEAALKQCLALAESGQ